MKMLVEVSGKKLEQGEKLRNREEGPRGEEEKSCLLVAFRHSYIRLLLSIINRIPCC